MGRSTTPKVSSTGKFRDDLRPDGNAKYIPPIEEDMGKVPMTEEDRQRIAAEREQVMKELADKPGRGWNIIVIPDRRSKEEPKRIRLGINGKMWTLQRNQDICVPDEFVSQLDEGTRYLKWEMDTSDPSKPRMKSEPTQRIFVMVKKSGLTFQDALKWYKDVIGPHAFPPVIPEQART